MRPQVAVCLLTVLAMAGCSSPAAEEDAAQFEDLSDGVSSTTGGIRGVVVDERIVPIEGAKVELNGASQGAATSDDQGRFVFSSLVPGTYFLKASSPLHTETQSSVDVVAGLEEPPIVRIQLERLFKQDPYSIQIVRDGFFECSQAGAGLYSSSNCVYDPYKWAFGPDEPSPTQPVDNVTTQEREWHADVNPGWQQLVFEMQWEPTTQSTSKNMGIVVSTYKPERDGAHCFAEFEGSTPIRGQIDVGEEHETGCGVEPDEIPPEGMQRMSYFVSVRTDGFTPGFAVNQQFRVYLTMFHYGLPPEGWSIVNGDKLPF